MSFARTDDGSHLAFYDSKESIEEIYNRLRQGGRLKSMEIILSPTSTLTSIVKVTYHPISEVMIEPPTPPKSTIADDLKSPPTTSTIQPQSDEIPTKSLGTIPKTVTSTTAQPTCERDLARLFVLVPPGEKERQLYNEFKIFGEMEYLYLSATTNSRDKAYAYLKYFDPQHATNALKQANKKYACQIAEPIRCRKGDSRTSHKIFHQPCGRYIDPKTSRYHDKVCYEQLKDKAEDPGTFVRGPPPKPTMVESPPPPPKSPSAIDWKNYPRLPGIRITLAEEDDPVVIHEETGRELDPFNGILWEDAKLIPTTPTKIEMPPKEPPTYEEIRSVLEYLTLMRDNKDSVEPPKDGDLLLNKSQE